MAVFKCKICGGTLSFTEGSSVCECQNCGIKQTMPKTNSEQNNTLYERAEHFRRNNDFDKAISIYEQILNQDNTDAEAYWLLVLCRYGVEYVEDPKSNKRIATVNRMQYTSVLADEDYKSALKYADVEQKAIYEAEAKEIDTIQKGILAISQKEEPFDVFICYKETDQNGRRTPDSVLANELYHQLVNAGFKTFFSRITLEDKLGCEYEPYIFAALNSAKVMVVIGTKQEYFNAVWVRNEWSRFLTLIKNGANKILIPAYRDMDPYDLPEEFSHLQAQDMSKLGFMQDLIYGIQKITKPVKHKETKDAFTSNENVTPLLRRAFLFLEDADWDTANDYFEKVLDQDPENAQAYLGKMMLDLKVSHREKLAELSQTFETNAFYKKILRFGNDEIIAELNKYIKTINQRIEHARLVAVYQKGELLMSSAKSKDDYIAASEVFASIDGFNDATQKCAICKEKANDIYYGKFYSAALAIMNSAKTEQDYLKASEAFDKIKEYEDAKKLSDDCILKAEEVKKDDIYTVAVSLMNGNKVANYKKAIAEFQKIPNWKDSDEKVEYCNTKIEEITALISAETLEKRNRAEARNAAKEERKRVFKEKLPLVKKIAFVVVPILVIAIVAISVLPKINWVNIIFTKDVSSEVGTVTDSSLVIDSSTDIVEDETSSSEDVSSDTSTQTSSNTTNTSTPVTSDSGTISSQISSTPTQPTPSQPEDNLNYGSYVVVRSETEEGIKARSSTGEVLSTYRHIRHFNEAGQICSGEAYYSYAESYEPSQNEGDYEAYKIIFDKTGKSYIGIEKTLYKDNVKILRCVYEPDGNLDESDLQWTITGFLLWGKKVTYHWTYYNPDGTISSTESFTR